MGRKTIEEMVEERYGDETVREAILNDVIQRGTARKIEEGELVLPGEQDAMHWHQRTQQQAAEEDKRTALERRMDEMEARMRRDEHQPRE